MTECHYIMRYSIGTPFRDVPELMKAFSSQLRTAAHASDTFISSTLSDIKQKQAALQLVSFAVGTPIKIHPFINGNGRMSRLTANYFLHRYGLPLLFRSPQNRPQEPDYAAAGAACMRGDFKPLYRYLLLTMATTSTASP